MAHFDDALELTKAVKLYHMAQRDSGDCHATPGLWDLYIIARASIAMIAFRLRATSITNKGQRVEDLLASQYQFISGVFMICREMMNTADDAIKDNSIIDAQALFRFADDNEIFTSSNGMVCAGSQKKIMEFLETCTGEVPSEKRTHISSYDNALRYLDGFVGSSDDWYKYAIACNEFDCFLEIEYLQRKQKLESATDNRLQDCEKIYQNIAQYCDALAGSNTIDRSVSFAEGALQRQNLILRRLGRSPINEIPPKRLIARMDY